VTNRSAQGGKRSSLHYGGEGVLIHPPHQGVCERHGTEDQSVTLGDLVESAGGTAATDPISEGEMGRDARRGVGRSSSTSSTAKAVRPRMRQPSGLGKATGEDGRRQKERQMSKGAEVDSSMSERPEHQRPRRLADWMNPTGERKVHSLIDKVYKQKNLEMAWESVKANRGAGGIDGQSIDDFAKVLKEQLAKLHEELRAGTYRPQPVRRQRIPKAGQPGKYRELGIPTVYDRVCQQALLNRLEPIFESVFDDASFGYRRGRSPHDALRKVWKELKAGREWVVDADLRDFFGSVDHDKLLALVAQRVSDGRVLGLIRSMLQAGSSDQGRLFPTERGTPQGGVVSPLLSNILLTPFDKEMRRRGYRLTRWADDWVITCESAAEARSALSLAAKVLEQLGVNINPEKTRIVNVKHGFEFLGYKIKRGKGLRLQPGKVRSHARSGELYAYPRHKSIQHFKDQVRRRTRRKAPVTTEELVQQLNPVLRGWGHYFKRAHVRKLFNQLDRWVVRRIWSHRHKRWRCQGWKSLAAPVLYGELGLVNLVGLIPSIGPHHKRASS
jgi:RNA-directed DNA polymerase